MGPAIEVLGWWLLFVVSHIGLTTAPVRRPLVKRLGEHGYVWGFSLVASIEFALLVARYAALRDAGAAGPGLTAARPVLIGAIVLGMMLMAGAFAPKGYWDSPAAPFGDQVRPARGMERITRHPFWAGLTLLVASHALLAAHLTGTVFFGGFVVLMVGGATHQAKKLRALRGPGYDQYLAQTSAIPFIAILRGRQRLVLRELPWVALALGVAAAWGLDRVHGGILAWHGAPLIAAVVVGTALIVVITSRRGARASLPAA